MTPYDTHRSSAFPDANQHITGSSEGMDTQLDDWSAGITDRDDMDTRLDDWSPTVPDVNQHIAGSSMNMQVDIREPTVPSVSNLSSSLSAKCTISPPRVIIDRFGSLPWFALEEILFNLPDLSTLHQLCQASPAVAEYLSDKVGIFPKVVEKIMDPWIQPPDSEEIDFRTIRHPDRGVIIDTSVFFRTLVYLWWKEDAVATGLSADENPLPDDFNNMWLYYINICLEGFAEPKKPHPGDAHAFFHGAMDLFKSTKIEELSYKKVVWKENRTRRPRGVPVDNSNAYWPLSWLEEQRLMQALLKPYIFSVLRRMVCEKRLLKTKATPPSPIRWDSTDTLRDLQKNALVDFWAPFSIAGETGNEPLEQLETILTWKEGSQSHGRLPKRDAKFTTCCPKFSELTDEQLKKGLWSLQHTTLPGPFLAQNCTHSVVRDAGLRGDFHKFGVSFWDMDRMVVLGLATRKMHRELDKKDLAFRWLTLLLSNKGPRKYGQKRVRRFRSRTKAIPVAK
ncbi:hypothetical protein N7449_010459 [Penicillium cf. viridicatum]|uniref:F-box domain-containing protein n=1 Tax=Penicillium cf. viridicatum TaxID=2972119 RepID=A0A9W9M361_9EURO|nr:hypothetical protein N7449_010459 [Penicillium cf. viridicatum]